jgi:cytochrome c oxidase cbb3-type subunit III
MSDFYSGGWSVFVAVASVVSMIACLVLLGVAARRKVMVGANGAAGKDDNTTGHVWDEDLTELNNPLPRWWMWLFIITVIFSLVYLVLYPGAGGYAGSLGWSSTGQHQAEQQAARDAMVPVYARYASADADTLMKDPAAMAIGERLFVNNCTACHGSDAHGSKGFPNLTDNDWLHGGDHASIVKTLTEGRVGMMPPLAAAVGDAKDLHNVAQYVLSLSGNATDAAAALAGPGQVRGLCGLPRRGWQGQHRDRRAEPHRQDLAARLRRGGDRCDGDEWQDQRHAGAGAAAHTGADPCARRLRDEPVARRRTALALKRPT